MPRGFNRQETIALLETERSKNQKALERLHAKFSLILTAGTNNDPKEAERLRVLMHEDLDQTIDTAFKIGLIAHESKRS